MKEDGSTELQLVEPKSDRSYRLVSIPASIVAFLARHRARQNRERLVAGSRWQQTGHTFASTIGTPLDERNVRREFYDLLKAQNLPRMQRTKERAAAKLDAILAGGNDNPDQNPGQTDPARVVDQEKSSNSFEDVVSRVGIEPTTRRLRGEWTRCDARRSASFDECFDRVGAVGCGRERCGPGQRVSLCLREPWPT